MSTSSDLEVMEPCLGSLTYKLDSTTSIPLAEVLIEICHSMKQHRENPDP